MASGPSLTLEDAERVRRWRVEASVRRVIVVNTTFRAAPWADVLYAADSVWWKTYGAEVNACGFAGERISATRAPKSGESYGTVVVKISHEQGLSKSRGILNGGGHSGYQAIGLAYDRGARKIVLLGYDTQRTNGMSHWHGDHPKNLRQNSPHDAWVKRFPALATDLEKAGVEVLNCSRETALSCFRRVGLEAALGLSQTIGETA